MNKTYRIVSYNTKTYEITPIEYFETEEEAETRIHQMFENKECRYDLCYFIQHYCIPNKPVKKDILSDIINEYRQRKVDRNDD